MGRRGQTGGGRLHNGGEENKAWKAWRLLACAASALPDTPPSSLPNQQKGEPKHHHAVSCILSSLSSITLPSHRTLTPESNGEVALA